MMENKFLHNEAKAMEEILTLKELLLKGDIGGALAIVEELEEMSKDDTALCVTNWYSNSSEQSNLTAHVCHITLLPMLAVFLSG